MTSLALDRWEEAQARARNGVLSDVQRLHELLKDDPRGLELLRALKVTEYHWIGSRPNAEPITGGHHSTFRDMVEECEMILAGKMSWPGPSSNVRTHPFDEITRIDIIDAIGNHVWSKERG